VLGGVLSQYDDDSVLHPVAFFSKNLLPAECNYEIYDKELLAIIRCLENWRPDLESTEIPIKIFTDHKALTYFTESKELTRRQARWSEKLSEFNFKIMYQTGPRNVKADALTRMAGSVPKDKLDERNTYNSQTILTPDRLDVCATGDDAPEVPSAPEVPETPEVPPVPESPFVPLYNRVLELNKTDEFLDEVREAIGRNEHSLNGITLRHCSIVDGVVYENGKLWVPQDDELHLEILREVHDQQSTGHPGMTRTKALLRRFYYWPGIGASIRRYISSCHVCHRTNAPRDKKNGLLKPLPIPERRWADISMDFIVGLPPSENMNAILNVMCRRTKERHYIPCTTDNEGTSAEKTMEMLMSAVYKHHGPPESIISDRGPQFIATVWKSWCRRLGTKMNLSTAFHPETDGQTERANQDVELQLRTFCNYYLDDWAKHLPLAEFADNANVSSATGVSPFFANKGFEPRMSFGPDETSYESTRERLQAQQAADITQSQQDVLTYIRQELHQTQDSMVDQANRHRREVEYEEGQEVWLDARNMKTQRPSKKLDDKMYGPFKISEKISSHAYRLDLPPSMKVHNVCSVNRLRPAAIDPLPGQINPPPPLIVIDGDDQWEVDDVLDSRHTGVNKRLQYKIRWHDHPRDDTWYNADDGEFANAQDVIDDFHAKYPAKPGPHNRPLPQPRNRPARGRQLD